jgi:hypothetical protein
MEEAVERRPYEGFSGFNIQQHACMNFWSLRSFSFPSYELYELPVPFTVNLMLFAL